MSDQTKQVKQALTGLIFTQPFFAQLALRLKVELTESIETAETDGESLRLNPAFIASLDNDQIKGLIAHEVLHCANGHVWRRDGRDMALWNKACDFAINQILLDAGFYLPKGAFIDPQYQGMGAEAIYGKLRQDKKPSKGQSQQQQPGNQPNQPGQGQQGQDPNQPGQGQSAPGEQWGGVAESPSADAGQAESEWKIATLQAAQQAKAMGKLPSGLERLIESIKNPEVDWKAALWRFVQETAKADYTWRMPNPRYLASGLFLPSLRSEQMRPLVVGMDTSGSVSETELAIFASELQAIMDTCQPESLTVIYCDAQVKAVEEFQSLEAVELHPKGGGGTAFQPVFDYVEQHGLDPACLVYFTDMFGSMPAQAPDYPVLWLSTSEIKTAPFGEVLHFPLN